MSSQKELKEAFVSNLNGTSLGEVALGSFLAPLCLISRGLFLILYHLGRGALPLPWIAHLVLDFSMIILPLVLSCTVLSDILHLVILGLMVVSGAVLCYIYRTKRPTRPRETSKDTVAKSFFQSHVQCDQVPFVTIFRVLVNVKTAISILAVDFSVFPRRYAKTETYGTGVMDFGVGAYVLANALVCPEARRKEVSGSKLSQVVKQLVSVWPLVILGLARLVSVKMSGYHEHVSEYGVHWNFFFTLAIVRVVASVLLALFPVNRSWLLALLIGGLYQVTLEMSGLKYSIIHNNDRTGGFLQANMEGVSSVVGYIAIYMAGVQIGLYVMRPRTQVKEWIRVIWNLLLGSAVLYTALILCQASVEPVSRRMANLPFCLWTIAQSMFFLSCLATADVILFFMKTVSGCVLVSSSWYPCRKEASVSEEKMEKKVEGLCLIQAVNRNQLLFFMLANLLTGITNVLVDTFNSSDYISVCVLLSYMFINSFAIYILHLMKITVKFW
ncbi:phosphatidylinositol-glycan biosynthesis class W protein [Salmo trutta]|uniref:Phosphatidylinositol-glycan biosynthesis class W protein n=1 Tax=Salmo trutta TaxID=8032 RepID=A0A673ZUW7_SALTR|nr:phosphatidylinositol-glycan biosynthesis class W protein [Salmo trutta]XP_029555402.1 phosphatidylinositol-glycan biosynthesis class W protein [Salmo trutta]XP_029555403.1 phosphatidylinositol-glycan biosynthesis class W protein [Salmo trutta]